MNIKIKSKGFVRTQDLILLDKSRLERTNTNVFFFYHAKLNLTFPTTCKEKGIQLITDLSLSWIYNEKYMISLQRYATSKVALTVRDRRPNQSRVDSYKFSVRWFLACVILESLLTSKAGVCCSSAGSGVCIHKHPCLLMFWLSQKEKLSSRRGVPKFTVLIYCRFRNLPSRAAVDRAKSQMGCGIPPLLIPLWLLNYGYFQMY